VRGDRRTVNEETPAPPRKVKPVVPERKKSNTRDYFTHGLDGKPSRPSREKKKGSREILSRSARRKKRLRALGRREKEISVLPDNEDRKGNTALHGVRTGASPTWSEGRKSVLRIKKPHGERAFLRFLRPSDSRGGGHAATISISQRRPKRRRRAITAMNDEKKGERNRPDHG